MKYLWCGLVGDFLSENDIFVAELEKRNITFVGPSSTTIRVLGDKIEAAELTERIKLNVPRTATVSWTRIEAQLDCHLTKKTIFCYNIVFFVKHAFGRSL